MNHQIILYLLILQQGLLAATGFVVNPSKTVLQLDQQRRVHHSQHVRKVVYASSGNDQEENITNFNEDHNDYNDDDKNNPSSNHKREIKVSASIQLPFEADVAFEAFSDLPRQPSWSSWLHSVSYIDEHKRSNKNDEKTDEYNVRIQQEEKDKRRMNIIEVRAKDGNESSTISMIEQEQQRIVDVSDLRQTKWVMGWRKIRFSWKSKVTFMERPKCIQWESTSGLKNMGKITFEEQARNDNKVDDVVTHMTLSLTFIAPRIVAGMMRRSDKIATFMKSQILRPTLRKFRDIVMIQDLGMDEIEVQDDE